MLQNLRDRASEEKGFTLIELLVVILIIGILAAIALPTFLGQKDKAKDSSTKSDVRNGVSQVESCLVDATVTTACNAPDGLAPGVGVSGIVDPDVENYAVTATSESGNSYTITKANGDFSRTSVVDGAAGTW